MEELLVIFKEEISEELSNLKKGFTLHDYELVVTAAHKVKSASGMLGFMDLMKKAEEVELVFKYGEGEKDDSLIEILISELEKQLSY
ncbi:MAG: Hpt domain-containing protein [Bacteroidota bacterium]